jgi:hypothetical protein
VPSLRANNVRGSRRARNPPKSFTQPMIGKQASGSFANLEIYLCGVY